MLLYSAYTRRFTTTGFHIIIILIGDCLEENDFEQYEDQDEASPWPFPDPNKGLEKYFSNESSVYMEEFEKWWNDIQANKQKIADFEYSRLIKSSKIHTMKFEKMFSK